MAHHAFSASGSRGSTSNCLHAVHTCHPSRQRCTAHPLHHAPPPWPTLHAARSPRGAGPMRAARHVATTPTPHLQAGSLRKALLGDRTCLVVRPTGRCRPGTGTDPRTQPPYLLYIPDIDGCGTCSRGQWDQLDAFFDLHLLRLLPEDRSCFAALGSVATEHIRRTLAEAPPERTAYLAGEGWGALIAVAAAAQCPEVNRLILINPATSYHGSTLALAAPLMARLPARSYKALAEALAPLLSTQPAAGGPTCSDGAAAGVARQREPDSGGAKRRDHLRAAEGAAHEMRLLAANLPPEALAWRLSVMQGAVDEVRALALEVEQRTMVLAAERDLLLPSASEAKRLAGLMQRAFAKVVAGAGHAVLQAPHVRLLELMQAEGFYTPRRRFTSPMPADGGAALGPAKPVELPTPQEVARYVGKWNRPFHEFNSPVFLSTAPDGSLMEGLGGLPDPLQGPLLFCGNHQLLGLDMNLLFERLYLERGVLLRGLAHPSLLLDNKARAALDPRAQALASVIFDFANTLSTFGAVPVTPTNFFRLLQRKEAVLLYPGGVREGFKRKGERYRLFWPSRSEFVRMAAKFGTTIVPFASIGAEDCMHLLMDTDEIASHPRLGPLARQLAKLVPDARAGVSERDEVDQTFIAPLAAPGVPARMYYLLCRPVTLEPALAKDRAECESVYRTIRGEVERALAELQRLRMGDPYRELLPRLLYEHPLGRPARQAPTFTLQRPRRVTTAPAAAAAAAVKE